MPFLQQDHAALIDVIGFQRPARHRLVHRRGEQETILKQCDCVDVRMFDRERAKDAIQFTGDQFADQGCGLRFTHVQPK